MTPHTRYLDTSATRAYRRQRRLLRTLCQIAATYGALLLAVAVWWQCGR